MKVRPHSLKLRLLAVVFTSAAVMTAGQTSWGQDAPVPRSPAFVPPQLQPSLLDFLTAKPIAEKLKILKTDKLLRPPFADLPIDTPKGLAAKIRAEELDVKNRVKAAEYLGTVDCVAYPEAQTMLMDMLANDKYERVRFEAAKALREMLGHGKSKRDLRDYLKGRARTYDICRGCCNQDVLNALAKAAYEKDEFGCWVEPSERVREMAKEAIEECKICCRQAQHYIPTQPPTETPEEPPVEEPMREEAPPMEQEAAPEREEQPPMTEDDPNKDQQNGADDSALQRATQSPYPFLVPPVEPERTADGGGPQGVSFLTPEPTAIASLRGYCVVALKDREFKYGNLEHTSVYEGRKYYFHAAAAKQNFDSNPQSLSIGAAGFDLVHLKQSNELLEGKYLREFGGRFFLFATKQNWETFKADPEAYLGQLVDQNVQLVSAGEAGAPAPVSDGGSGEEPLPLPPVGCVDLGCTTGTNCTDGANCLPQVIPCPQPIEPSPITPDTTTPPEPTPSEPIPPLPPVEPEPPMTDVAPPITDTPSTAPQQPLSFNPNLQGSTLLASRNVPAMLSDFFGAGGTNVTMFSSMGGPITSMLPDIATGGAYAGRQKLAENTSPIPVDRLFVNYSFFDDTSIVDGGISVHRFTPGFEKTFLNGDMSFEARFPIAITQAADIGVNGQNGLVDKNLTGELGNITLFLKALLYETERTMFSAGLGVALPTADDIVVNDMSLQFSNTAETLLRVDNESVHLLPFIGGVYTPNDRLFASWIAQVDIDTNGQGVAGNNFGTLVDRGTLQDTTYLFLDGSVGYWLYRNQNSRTITGFAPIAELHINQSLGDADTVDLNGDGIHDVGNRGDFTLVNLVLGATAVVRDDLYIQSGYVVPLAGGNNTQFDGEFRLMINWTFGGGRRPGGWFPNL